MKHLLSLTVNNITNPLNFLVVKSVERQIVRDLEKMKFLKNITHIMHFAIKISWYDNIAYILKNMKVWKLKELQK
jgi:hypothetical protein